MNREVRINTSNILLALIFKNLITNIPMCKYDQLQEYNNFLRETVRANNRKVGLTTRKGYLHLCSEDLLNSIYMQSVDRTCLLLRLDFVSVENMKLVWQRWLRDVPEDYLLDASSEEALLLLGITDCSKKQVAEVRKFIFENTPQINPALIMIALVFQSVASPEKKACSVEKIKNFASAIISKLEKNSSLSTFSLPIIDYDVKSEKVYKWNANKTYRVLQPPYDSDDAALLKLWESYLAEIPSELITAAMSEEALVALLGVETAKRTFDAIVEFVKILPDHFSTKERV